MGIQKYRAAPLSSDYLITLNDPRVLWNENWLAVVLEVVGAALLYQIFKNVKRGKTETFFLIITAMISTMGFEILPLLRPGYELWWFHPGLINVIRGRLPTYVITTFALAHYVADCLTNDMKLPTLSRSLVTAVISTLIIAPFVWMAPRLLLITYHFADSVFNDRIFDVPATELLVFFLLFFHTSHLFSENCEELSAQQRNNFNYTICALQSGLVAAIYTTIEQYVIHILFKLTLGFHAGTCILGALGILVYLAKGELDALQIKSTSMSGVFKPLRNKAYWGLAAGFIFLTALPLWMNFEDLKSTGARLELGPCHVTHLVSNTNPLEHPRRRFICPEDTRMLNYDFHCVAPHEVMYAVKDIKKVYTICGKTMTNYLQTVQILAAYSAICMLLIHCVARLSFTFLVEKSPIPKKVE